MAASRAFSTDLPLSRGEEGDHTSSQSNDYCESQDNDNLNDLFDRYDTNVIELERDQIERSETNNSVNNTERNLIDRDIESDTVRDMRTKPSVVTWLNAYNDILPATLENLFNRFNLDRDNYEVSWFKLYDYLDSQDLDNIIDSYRKQANNREITRSNTNFDPRTSPITGSIIDLSENSEGNFCLPNNSRFGPNTRTYSARPFNLNSNISTAIVTATAVGNSASAPVTLPNTFPKAVNFAVSNSIPVFRNTARNAFVNPLTTANNWSTLNTGTTTVFTTIQNPLTFSRPAPNTGAVPRTHRVQNPWNTSVPLINPNRQSSNRTNPVTSTNSNRMSSSNAGNQLISALENLTLSTTQYHKPPFFKFDSDPKQWVKKYEKSAILNNWREEHKVRNFAKHVNDDVLNWIAETFVSLENIDWRTFKYAFLSEFQSKDKGISNRIKLNHLRQGREESVRAYIHRGLDLIDSVNERMRESEKIEILAFGLKCELREKIINVGTWPIQGGLRTFKQICINAENFLEMNRVIDNPNVGFRQSKNEDNGFKKPFNPKNLNFKRNVGNNNQKFNAYPSNYKDNKKRDRTNNNKQFYGQSPSDKARPGRKPDERQNNRFYHSNKDNRDPDNTHKPERHYTCYGCGQDGHIVSNCPKRAKERQLVREIENTRDNDKHFHFNRSQGKRPPKNWKNLNNALKYNPNLKNRGFAKGQRYDEPLIDFGEDEAEEESPETQKKAKPKNLKVLKTSDKASVSETIEANTESDSDLNEAPHL